MIERPVQLVDEREKHQRIDVQIKTPAGFSHEFELQRNERIRKVIREAVEYFVGQGQLQDGEYDIALIRDGNTLPLAESGRVDDYGIVDGDTLSLIDKSPQVDGDAAPCSR